MLLKNNCWGSLRYDKIHRGQRPSWEKVPIVIEFFDIFSEYLIGLLSV